MHVFQLIIELELAGSNLLFDIAKALLDFLYVIRRKDALLAQHARMGQRAFNVMQRQFLVEADGSVDRVHDGRGPACKTAAPQGVAARFAVVVVIKHGWARLNALSLILCK